MIFLATVFNDILVVGREVVFNPLFVGVLFGIALSTLGTAIFLVKQPRVLSCIVLYDHVKSFETSASRTANGTYTTSFTHFRTLYPVLRALLLSTIIALVCLVSALLLL